MKIVILGAGLVGRRTAELLAAQNEQKQVFAEIELVSVRREVAPLAGVTTTAGWVQHEHENADLVVLATESRGQASRAKALVARGVHVVSTADDPTQIRHLCRLEILAQRTGAMVVAGAAYSPGVSSLLVAQLVKSFDEVSSISTAQFGTGGPACAREHHRAMNTVAREVHGGRLRRTRPGSGRQLIWFPEPVGAADCFRAGLAEPFLLHRSFPTVPRIESRQAATRRDRMTARLPMLRSPHAEGLLGAVWAEVRGVTKGSVEHHVMGMTGPQATGAAGMAAAAATELAVEGTRSGIYSAATFKNPVSSLRSMPDGMRLWTYDGRQIPDELLKKDAIQAARKWRGAL